MGRRAFRPGACALALASGACLAFAFPVAGAWWWAWVGLVPLVRLLAKAGSYGEAGTFAWCAAVGFFATLHHWVLPALGMFAPVALAVAGLSWVPFGLVAYGWLRRPSAGRVAAAVLVLPSVWLVSEVVRSWEHLSGGWGLLGASQWRVPPVLALAALGGVWLIGFVLVAVNVGLAAAVLPCAARRARLLGAGVAATLAVLTVWYGYARPEPVPAGGMRVAGVQTGEVPGPDRRVAEHLRLTRELAGREHDVVVWGQSSVAIDPRRHPGLDRALRRASAEVRSDLLVNVDAAGPSGRITKTTYQYTPGGVVNTYVKQRLVPFGEYVPLRPLLGPLLEHTEAADQDRAAGDRLTVLDVSGRRVGPLVSYESTFPDMRRQLAAMGADVTVVQGSLTTFQGSWAHAQQASLEAVRAVESGRPAVLVSLSGTSAAFDARGRPLTWLGPDHCGVFVVNVPLSHEVTPYVHLGDRLPAVAAGILALATATRALRHTARRGSGTHPRRPPSRRAVEWCVLTGLCRMS